jgi:hypothetical protein
VVAYLFSGHTGIYRSQRVGRAKFGAAAEGMRVGEVRAHHAEVANDTSSRHCDDRGL